MAQAPLKLLRVRRPIDAVERAQLLARLVRRPTYRQDLAARPRIGKIADDRAVARPPDEDFARRGSSDADPIVSGFEGSPVIACQITVRFERM